jgi:hypothetical protein
LFIALLLILLAQSDYLSKNFNVETVAFGFRIDSAVCAKFDAETMRGWLPRFAKLPRGDDFCTGIQ